MVHRKCKEKTEMFHIIKVLGIIFSVMLIYSYNSTILRYVPMCQDPHFELLTPYNTTRIPVTDEYNKLIDIKNFSFLINTQTCEDYESGILLIIIVSSHPKRFENRKVIRSTWGGARDYAKVVFLVGQSADSKVERNIRNESEKYGDIIQGNFMDAYRNMTYKHIMGFKWVMHHCATAKYILKTDDDVLVNSIEMSRFLSQELSPWGSRGLILCPLASVLEVQRSGKWKVAMGDYSEKYYPKYCLGWTILYSRDVIARLLSLAQKTKYFWIDDAFITGILAEKLQIPRTSFETLILNGKRVDSLMNKGPSYAGRFLFGPQDQKLERIMEIWRVIAK